MTGPLEFTSDSKSLEILGRIRTGDDRGWDDLYRLYHDELLFTVRTQLGTRLRTFLESEDIFQSVALDALHALQNFEHRGEGSLRRYLHRMVLNKIRDRSDTVRARKRSGAVPLNEELAGQLTDPSSEVRYYDPARFESLERGLAALPEDMRQVLMLRKIEGYSSKETAERLGKSDAATRKLYSRALARLSRVLRSSGAKPDSDDQSPTK